MVMEFCPSDLRKAVQHGIPTSRAFRLFTEILQGIDYIHKQHMVHNDLKPDNIFLDSKNSVKLGDFGLARHCDRSQCHGPVQGTSLYLPPEAVQFPSPLHSSKTDMFAIGIIVFEMYVKLNRNNFWTIIQQLRADPQTVTHDNLSRVNISPMKYNIIPQLLSKNANQRPSAGELLCHLNVGNQCPRGAQQKAPAPEWWRQLGAARVGHDVVLDGIVFEDVRMKHR